MKCTDQRGAALVEFALVLPVLLLILMAILELGVILYDKAVITSASREAAHERILFNARGENDIRSTILASYGGLPITFGGDRLGPEDITFTAASEASGTYWTVTVNFGYDFLYLPFSRLALSSSTTMRQE